MTTAYEAILNGDRVTWVGQPPPSEATNGTRVTVAISNGAAPITPEERRKRMIAALEALAALPSRSFDGVDPVAWQREVRADRPLPGRNP